MIKYRMKSNIDINKIKKLFDAELHLGHKKNRVHPNVKRFIYKIENGVSIIDLTLTAQQIDDAKQFLNNAVKENKTILVVATKKIASKITSTLCDKFSLPFVTTKWPPGLLTNFDTIVKNVEKLKELKKERDLGNWNKILKHERVFLNKQMIKLEKFYGGLISLDKKPDILIVLDTKKEKNAVNEARQKNVAVVGIIDTNSDPNEVDYPIVANDDSPRSVEYLMNELINGIKIKSKK